MKEKHWLLTVGKIRYREQYLQNGLQVFNDTMRAVAARHSVLFFDLPKVLPPSGYYFYDDCHFNNNGSITAAKMLADFITPLFSGLDEAK
jgi:hypothetical protein